MDNWPVPNGAQGTRADDGGRGGGSAATNDVGSAAGDVPDIPNIEVAVEDEFGSEF